MKKISFLIVLLIFILSGCQTSSDIKELSSRINNFEDSGNQFEIEITIDIDVTQDEETESVTETMTGQVQIDPFYTSITSGDITVVEIINDDVLETYTMDSNYVVNGLQLYTKETLLIESIDDPLSDLDFDFSEVEVTRININEFQIAGKLVEFMPESMMEDLKEVLIGSGISEEEIDDISIDMIFKFGNDTFEYDITMNFDINDVELEIHLSALFTKGSFEVLDFEDDTKFYPMSSNETQDSIDISQPIVFTADNYHVTSYYAYFEAGKYGFYSNVDIEHHTIAVYDETGGASNLLVFKEEYNRYYNNTNNISRFYNIPADGYYFILIDYPVVDEPYIIEVRKIESITDGTESPTLTVTESGVFNYEIESAYDFYSIHFDLNQGAIIRIKDSNDNQLYFNQANEPYFWTVEIPETGIEYYVSDANQIAYLHNPNGPSNGTLTIDVIPIVHATSPDEPMLQISDQFSDELIITGYLIPIQYIAFEVTEKKQYTFEFLMSSGDIEEAGGGIYKEDGTAVQGVANNQSVPLMPGNYYYVSSNYQESIYSIRYVISDVIETSHHIDSIQSHAVLTGNLFSYPQYTGTIMHLDEYIVYYFTLLETTDITFYQKDKMFELYDSSNNRIDIANISGLFVYRLDAGDYYITVSHPDYYTEYNFPVDYSLILFKFTGGGEDISVYPFVQEITLGWGFNEATMDYTGDYDGFNFTLTKTEKVSIYSTDTAILLKGNRIWYSSVDRKEVTLEAGTYTIMCKTHNSKWTVSVRVVTP